MAKDCHRIVTYHKLHKTKPQKYFESNSDYNTN